MTSGPKPRARRRQGTGDMPAAPDALPRCPAHLADVARKEWRRLAKPLYEMGVLSTTDRAALAAYCQAWARWVEAEEHLRAGPPLIKTPSGYVQQSPWLAIANKQLEIMGRYMTAVASLVPYARNAKMHPEAQVGQIAASIQEWGFTAPVLIDEHRMIIAGHGRVLAAQKLGLIDIPFIMARGCSRFKSANDALNAVAEKDKAFRGLLIKTKQGNWIQNPLVGVARRAADDMTRLAAEFGMTPSSRTRLQVKAREEVDEWADF